MSDSTTPGGEPDPTGNVIFRTEMAVMGGFAGLALWYFADVLPDRVENLHGLLFAAALVLGTFAVLLALAGPLRVLKALSGALAVAGPAALLLLWASFRYAEVGYFLKAGHGLAAFALILFIATPFVAAALQAPGGARDYARLFDIAWTIVVRYAAGWLFVGLFWLVLLLSDQLLQLVGIGLIDRLLRVDPVPYVLSGLVLGLALAVVHELRDYVSPYLIHRLLRLLLPVMLPVVALFILALPVRGLSGLFGSFSAAATLMAVAAAGITLISTALDRSDEDAAGGAVMIWSMRAFSLAVPVLAGLGLWAVWQRVVQYGWTPPRLSAAMAGLFLLTYGLAYAAMVLRGGAGWMARIRAVNLNMAMLLVAAAALWLTPVLNAENIAAESQLTRARTALDRPDKAALWELAHAWGHPGERALRRLEDTARAEKADAMLAAIESARSAGSRYAFDRRAGEEIAGRQRDELADLMPLRPVGAVLPAGAFAALPPHLLRQWLNACRRNLPDGRPGCALVLGDFRPGLERPNGFVLLNRPGFVHVQGVVMAEGGLQVSGGARPAGNLTGGRRGAPVLDTGDLAAVLDGAFEIVPVPVNALKIGAREIIPDN